MRARPGEPGLYFEVAQPRPQPSPIRSDVVGLLAHTRRGPLGRLVRVEGWRQFLRVFGGLVPGAMSPYAVRGYFENGGEVAHVWRVAGPETTTARAVWNIDPAVADAGAFRATRYTIVASSPGAWGNGLAVSARYRARGRLSKPEIDIVVRAPDETTETFRAIAPEQLTDAINPRPEDPDSGSALIRIVPDDASLPPAAGPAPAVMEWNDQDLPFSLGADDPPGAPDYSAGTQALLDEPEVAILAAPDLFGELPPADIDALVTQTIAAIDSLHDRLLLLDVPGGSPGEIADPVVAIAWLSGLRSRNAGTTLRNVSIWHPPLGVPDPLGGAAFPIKLVPASGHVAGVVSRLDRERGPHWTPANAECLDAVDVGEEWQLDEREALYREGINLVRCIPGKGLQLWGAWTAIDPRAVENVSYLYLAHRRLVHRLVRAIRTIVEPLVFDPNTATFRFSVQRSINNVLLRFWRAGAFRGSRPDEAFRVVCDDSNNPPEEQDNGRVWCEIQIAPALPMEFITLRIALGEAGRLEVFA
jgi:phage tail sheath protein FI